MKQHILEHEARSYYFFERALLTTFSRAMAYGQAYITEEAQVHGAQNVLAATHKGPYLWLFRHECMHDAFNLAPLWKELPDLPPMLIASRTQHSPIPFVREIVGAVMHPVVFELHRVSMGEGKTEVEKEALRQENERRLNRVKASLRKGVHAAMFPEGTVKTNGRISKIRAGCYNISHLQREDGGIDIIPAIPLGLTYDFMSGKQGFFGRKSLVFINIGKPIVYAPVERNDGESYEAYIKRDIHAFTGRIRDDFISLSAITTAQLCSEQLLQKSIDQRYDVSRESLSVVIAQKVEKLRSIEGLMIDEALLDSDLRNHRVRRCYRTLEEEGFIAQGKINAERCLKEPSNLDGYYKENPVLFSANRLYEMMQYDQRIADAMR